jgi:dolichyl-phosphate-mannose--protein O-mannosyl transferase
MPWRAPRRPVEFRLPVWQRALIPFLLFAGAFGAYQYHVDHPPIIIFDEAHYVKVARNYTNGILIDPAWGAKDPRPQNFEHPPLGKYLIAVGIWLNGKPHNEWENQKYITQLCGGQNEAARACVDDARGWRFASTVVGASGIVAAYLLAMRLFNNIPAGFFAAGLLMLDGMYYIHARLAMLDIFPTAFWLWAFAFALSPYKGGRWWGAVFFGLALASKYYTLYLLPVFLLVQFIKAPIPRWRDHADEGVLATAPLAAASVAAPEGTSLVQAQAAPALPTAADRLRLAWEPMRPWFTRVGWAVLLAVAVPIGVLLATYLPYFYLWTRSNGFAFAIKEWVFVQVSSFTWIYAGDATHPFSSPPWSWIPMIKPVYYYTYDYPDGTVGKMWSIGNPFLWWTASAGLVVVPVLVLVRFFRRHARTYLRWDFLDALAYYPFWYRRDLHLMLGALLFWSAYLPWFLVQRILFMFYMTFVVPTFAIFAGGLLGERWDRGGFPRILTILYVVLALVVFALYFPILAGSRISKTQYDWIMSIVPWLNNPDWYKQFLARFR